MDSAELENADVEARPVSRTVVRPNRVRVYAALVLVAAASLLGLAAWLKPDPGGYGTHRQLGFGKCGMLVTTGYPCPTCGMTTAFAHAVRGQWLQAIIAQPAGFLLALATIACVLGSLWVLVSGRLPPIRLPIVSPFAAFFTLLIIFLGSWAFKIVWGLAHGTLPEGP